MSGLSRLPKSDKGEISSFQLLLTIAQGIDALVSDPKALEKAAKESFALSDAEEAKAIQAKQDIAKNEALLSEQRKKQNELDASIADLEKKKSGIQQTLDDIKKEQARLAKKDSDLGDKALQLSTQEADLKDRENKLVSGNDDLKKRVDAAAYKEKQLNEFEAMLKDKASKLRSIVDA